MIRLTKEEILVFHQQLIDRYGGLPGIRDEGLLDSALNMPFQGFGETDFYPTIPEKAVRLCFGLVKNHPFFDGNKRIGAMALTVLLDLNHYSLRATKGELSKIILQLAANEISNTDLLQWVYDRLE